MGDTWKCPHCGKSFKDANAQKTHHLAKHRDKKLPKRVKTATTARPEREESIAERAIQAQLDHAMGIDNPDYDWLVDPYK